MGDIADMMIDGTLCGTCGVLLPGEPYGVPRYCKDCGPPRSKDLQHRKKRRTKKRGR
jgi:hypothetical protein